VRDDTTVLVAFDGSDPGVAALEFALREYPDADITVLTVVTPALSGGEGIGGFPASSEVRFEQAREEAEDRLDEARALADQAGVDVDTAVEVGRPASVIVEYADEHDAESVVLGSHGRDGLSRVLLGSVAEAVVRQSPVPVTVVR